MAYRDFYFFIAAGINYFMVYRNVDGDNKCRLVVFKHDFY